MPDSDRVMAEYGKRKVRRGWAVGIMAVVVLISPALLDSDSVWLAVTLALGIVLGAVLVDLVVWRCPACDTRLGRDWDYTFCPHCSVRLHL